MNDSIVSRIGVLVVLIAALVSAVVNVLMKGVLGLAVFAVADIPLSPLLPGFHGDYLPAIGTIYGLFWPLLMAGIFIITVNRRVPEKWQKSPLMFRSAFMALSTVAMSVVLALPFHLYGIWMTHREYGV
jgi:hypothetical protein